MPPGVTLQERVNGKLRKKLDAGVEHAVDRPTVLIATIDPEIRSGLTDLFQAFPVDTIWSQGVEAAKNMLATERIAACLCGFWLQDGTYRELVRHVRRQRVEIPLIIVSAPTCPHEYHDYLAAMNIETLDFLCHPYRKSELERLLRLAMGIYSRSMSQRTSMVGPDFHAGEAA